MVDCPRCRNGMHYIGTDVEAEIMSEGLVRIHAKAHYHCASCFADVVIPYQQDVELK